MEPKLTKVFLKT